MTTNKDEDVHHGSPIMSRRARPEDTESLSRLLSSTTTSSTVNNTLAENNNNNHRNPQQPVLGGPPRTGDAEDVIEILDCALAILEEDEPSGNTSQQGHTAILKPSKEPKRPGQ